MRTMSYAKILDQWPSTADLARDLGRPLSTVRAWRRRDRIPADAWDHVIASAKSRGLRGVSVRSLRAALRARQGVAE